LDKIKEKLHELGVNGSAFGEGDLVFMGDIGRNIRNSLLGAFALMVGAIALVAVPVFGISGFFIAPIIGGFFGMVLINRINVFPA
jgi:hypothetical protein